MKTLGDLGRLMKKKYPGSYDDLSDEEAGRLTKKKWPGSYDDYAEVSLSASNPIEMARYEPRQPTRTETNVEQLIE